jgi:hypothetical protein
LCEDDPDDFVTLEMPTDSMTTDSDAPPLELETKRKSGFLDSIRKGGRNMSGLTVITGNKRMRNRSGGELTAVEGEKPKLPLHDLGDEACVLQGERREEEEEATREAADCVGGLGRVSGMEHEVEEYYHSREVSRY